MEGTSMTDAFVAVDSGGTRSSVAVTLSDSPDRQLRYATSEVMAGTTPPELYPRTLRRILVRAKQHLDDVNGEFEHIYLFMGAAGFAHVTREDFADAFEEVLPELFEGRIAAAGAANDGTTLILGHEADAVVIAGTGSTVMIRDNDSAIHIAGGHDWVGCDYGSGFWIGLRGIRQASRDFEGATTTDVLERFREVYSVRSNDPRAFIAKLRELAMADALMKGEIARFAAAVCQAAGRGDVQSQDIIKVEAEDLADVAASAVRRRLGIERISAGISFVQCGGLMGNDFYREIFEKQVIRRLMNVDGEPALIHWKRVDTGAESVMNMAFRLREDVESLTQVDRHHMPLVVIP